MSQIQQKRKQKKIQKKRRLNPLVLVILFGVLLLTALFGTGELSSATWGDGTDAFYKEVLSNDGNFVENAGTAIFDNQPVSSISKQQTKDLLTKARNENTQVLGLHTASDGSEKWIEIDLSDKKLYAWQEKQKVYEFLISTGRPGFETPTGEFRVWRKVRSQRYVGGIPGTDGYYNLPNVPYSLFFGGGNIPNWKGYAVHGAYWHNDFGIKNRSSGCVNVKPEEASLLYQWAGPAISEEAGSINAATDNPGVRVLIHE